MSLFCWSLLALASASSVISNPLSTVPYNAPRQRSPFSVAPLLAAEHPHGTINNSYIVMLKSDVPAAVMQNHFNFLEVAHSSDPLLADGSGVQQVYDGHIKGYAGKFTEGVVEQIRSLPEVDYVERDQIVRTMDVQKSAPWGLARISNREKLTLGTFSKYKYDADGGEGVDVYVIDTGININHVEFEGRASWGKTIPQGDVDEDNNGHGSHCAGTIASRKYGVAKSAHVIAVKVLGSNGSGTMSDVIAGVVFAVTEAQKKAKDAEAEFAATGKTKHRGSVANMSLGGGSSRSLDEAVNRAVDAGLHFAVAAGNDDRDACNYSPAAAVKAVTVGASTLGDERAYFSNHGSCVDIFAPGLNILSTYTGSPDAVASLSGTSMASPHTAGMLAYLLSIYPSATFNPNLSYLFPPTLDTPVTPALGLYTMVHAAMPGWVSGLLPSPRLVAMGADAVAPAPGKPKTLSPVQLKKALIALSSRDVLATLPENTANLLIFNNATDL